jgi:hypothetical protein
VTDIHCQCVIMETIGKGGTPVWVMLNTHRNK